MVPETGGCPCYYARRFFGKVYCKHEALLCLFLRKDPKALLPECSRPWIPSTVEMDGVREGSGNQPLCSVLTDSERMSVPAMPETSEASVSQHKGMFDHCHFNALQKPNDGCVWGCSCDRKFFRTRCCRPANIEHTLNACKEATRAETGTKTSDASQKERKTICPNKEVRETSPTRRFSGS
mmetsp:Transcript_8179/g.13227  ORF Transcript_8179/g.13227 Transcript_8179/m.13227 type:complete len:181 (+) Transcript_8179:812-1354(+)